MVNSTSFRKPLHRVLCGRGSQMVMVKNSKLALFLSNRVFESRTNQTHHLEMLVVKSNTAPSPQVGVEWKFRVEKNLKT
ncbi:hypothetical protein TNCV_4519751 [Trichonephila clavipes]|nr:hypothetical protein TNCV_4519751 [Trichonephila clavipes]